VHPLQASIKLISYSSKNKNKLNLCNINHNKNINLFGVMMKILTKFFLCGLSVSYQAAQSIYSYRNLPWPSLLTISRWMVSKGNNII